MRFSLGGRNNYQEIFVYYSSFTDIFEEGGFDSTPFHQGFGVQTIYNIPKPAYRAFQLLHATGDERVYVAPYKYRCFANTLNLYSSTNVDILVTTNSTHLVILASNFDYATESLTEQTFCVNIKGKLTAFHVVT